MSKLRSQLDKISATQVSTGGNLSGDLSGRRTLQPSTNQPGANPSLLPNAHAQSAGQRNDTGMDTHSNSSENRRELAQIKLTLQQLTQQLATREAQNTPSTPASAQPIAKPVDTQVLANSLSHTLREDLRDQMSVEIDNMRNELGSLKQSANEANDKIVLDDIKRISQGIHELQNRQVISPDQFGEMAGELRGMHREIQSLGARPVSQFDSSEITQTIQANYNEISKRLESIGESHAGNQLEVLSEKLETLQASLKTTDPQMLVRIEEQLQALGTGISTLSNIEATGSSNELEGALAEYFEGLDRRMDEISRAIVASTPATPTSNDETAFDRIEARIASLAKSVDNLGQENTEAGDVAPKMAELYAMPEQLKSTFADLEARISQISSSNGAHESRLDEEFGSQLATLTQKIDQLNTLSGTNAGAENILDQETSEVGIKLDQLALTLERAINSGDGSVGQLESQISDLSSRLELLDASLGNSNSHSEQFLQLENQIISIAAQLETVSGQPDLSTIESRLGGIEEQFAANQIDTGGDQTSAISALANDLQNLTLSSTELKGHSLETFDAVRHSLSMILDRINGIEMRMANEEVSTHLPEPLSPPNEEFHSTEMVDAAREYASSLAQQNANEFEHSNAGEMATAAAVDSGNGDARADTSNERGLDAPVGQHSAMEGGLPQVDAPSIDLQHLPPLDEQPQGELDTFIGDDLPLEPGSGAPVLSGDQIPDPDQAPDMNSLMRQAKEKKRKNTLEDEQKNPTDFIAAARRAAQAASEEQAEALETAENSDDETSQSTLTGKKKKMLFAGVAAAAIIALAFPAISYFTGQNSDQVSIVEATDLAANEVPDTNSEVSDTKEVTDGFQQDARDMQPALVDGVVQQMPFQDPATQVNLPRALGEAVELPADNDAAAVNAGDAMAPVSDEKPAMTMVTQAPMPPEEVGPVVLRQAAASGNAKALFEVARRYTKGLNGTPDLKEAAVWYQRSADLNLAPAQYRLGNFMKKAMELKAMPIRLRFGTKRQPSKETHWQCIIWR